MAAENERLREAIRRLAEQDATLSVCDGNVTVQMDAAVWIPARERLPATQLNVLLSRPPEHRQSRFRIMRLIDQGYEQYWADDTGYTSPITSYDHWMPLPEPPGAL